MIGSVGVAALFWLAASAIVMLRDDAVPYKPGQYVPQDILSRVDFTFTDPDRLAQVKREKRASEPQVYKSTGDAWGDLEKSLDDLPERVGDKDVTQLPPSALDGAAGGAGERRGVEHPAAVPAGGRRSRSI